MKIGFLTHEYPPVSHGGIGRFTQTLGRALVASGHQVTVMGAYKDMQETHIDDDMGVKVIRFPQARMPAAAMFLDANQLYRTLLKEHRHSPFDIIDGPELSYGLLPRHMPMARIVRMHGGHHFFSTMLNRPVRRGRGFVERRSFRNADAYCGVSQYIIDVSRELLHLGDVPIEHLPNPVDTSKFLPMPEIEEEADSIVFVGTVTEKKGVKQLVQAMRQVIAAVPDAKLYLYGRDTIDATTNRSTTELLRETLSPDLQEQVIFKGTIPNTDLPHVLARAQVAAYPSHMEALGIVFLEAMAMGKAVVGPGVGPGPEVFENGRAALLCDPFNADSIAEQIILLLKDSALRKQIGSYARQRVEEHYSLPVQLERNLAFFRRVSEAFQQKRS